MRQRGRLQFIVGFLAPAVLIFGLFVVVPLIQAFQLSLYRWDGLSPQKIFVGLGNFADLAKDDVFRKALQNNLVLIVVGGFFTIAIGVAVAHGLGSNGRGARFLRGIVLFPQIVSVVVVATLWMFLFNPNFGLLNVGLRSAGLPKLAKTWLGDYHTAFGAVGVAFVWYMFGFYAMLFAAGLKALPAEVMEAAELDGAEGMARFWQVTWPMLWSVKRVAFVHFATAALNVFTLVILMTNGGPSRTTEVLLTYLYQRSFTDNQFGYGSAVAVANFVVAMIIAVALILAFRRDPEKARG